MELIRHCLVCGKEFKACNTCQQNIPEALQWRRVVCCPAHFSYATGTKTLSLPTAISDAGTIEVVYDYEKDGATVGNSADTYGKTTHTFINCLGKNTCDETYFIQLEIYRCDWNANFDLDMGGDGVEHPFQFKSLVDKCGAGDSKFWNYKVYKTA